MFLGIDIGTSGVKVNLVDREGTILAQARRAVNTYGKEENKRELSPEEVADKALEAAREVLGHGGGERLKLITVASLGEAVVPVDRDGNVLMNSIIGSDIRGGEELDELCRKLGEDRLTHITKQNRSAIYSLAKILYLKKYYPKMAEKVWKYMCFTDYMGYVLTGEAKIDYSMASRTFAFDAGEKRWSEEILSAAELSAHCFSEPVQGGSVIGELSGPAKRTLGLSYGVPVMAGSHDHIMNALGAGAVSPGVCSNVVGTTEGLTTVLRKAMPDRAIRSFNISCEPFVLPDLYNTVAWHNAAGAMVNWFLDTFCAGDMPDIAARGNAGRVSTGRDRDGILEGLNSQDASKPSGLMVLPHFAGATARYMDERARGAIVGLTLTTSREEIYKAVLEGACYECRTILECLKDAGIAAEKIVVSGGGSRSRLWMQLKANILGMPVYRSSCADTGALGGAVLAAYVCGYYGSLEEAAARMVPETEEYLPDQGVKEIYKERYEEYKELYPKLKELNHKL